MSEQEVVRIQRNQLEKLIAAKLRAAGLSEPHAKAVAEHLAFADSRGVHSHGSVRVEYYAERIAKGGSNTAPNITWEVTGPCTGLLDGDNAVGFVVANEGMDRAVAMAQKNGVAVVGMRRMGHCGTLSYYLRRAVASGMLALSTCQSDPMVVPYGGAQAFFGTNPIGFAAPVKDSPPMVFDMATTVGAWGKVLNARARNLPIDSSWAVDKDGNPTTDPFAVRGMVPMAGAKGYGLMMMVDVLAGILVGAPYGPHVSSMYTDLSAGRELGHLHVVINPDFFCGRRQFEENMARMMDELHRVKPAAGFDGVLYPGENSDLTEKEYERAGIPIVREIYDYLTGDAVHFNRYETGDPFATAE